MKKTIIIMVLIIIGICTFADKGATIYYKGNKMRLKENYPVFSNKIHPKFGLVPEAFEGFQISESEQPTPVNLDETQEPIYFRVRKSGPVFLLVTDTRIKHFKDNGWQEIVTGRWGWFATEHGPFTDRTFSVMHKFHEEGDYTIEVNEPFFPARLLFK